jgi:FkbM family methyltransferase
MGLSKTFWFVNHPLNRGQKFHSLKRFVKWQIGSRLVPGPIIVPFVNDACLIASPGMTGATGNIYAGLHEFEDMAFILHSLRPDDLFVDVGANVGSYTILASAVAGARSITFEPVPETYRKLLKNIWVNNISALVDARNLGIGSVEGTVSFTIHDKDTMSRVSETNDATGIQIPIQPLDAMIPDQIPVVMKIDVEGYETEVIKGAAKTLRQDAPLAVLLELNGLANKYGYDEKQLCKMMFDSGFETFAYAPFERRLVPLKQQTNNRGNTLFIKHPDFFHCRVKEAAPFRTNGQKI